MRADGLKCCSWPAGTAFFEGTVNAQFGQPLSHNQIKTYVSLKRAILSFVLFRQARSFFQNYLGKNSNKIGRLTCDVILLDLHSVRPYPRNSNFCLFVEIPNVFFSRA